MTSGSRVFNGMFCIYGRKLCKLDVENFKCLLAPQIFLIAFYENLHKIKRLIKICIFDFRTEYIKLLFDIFSLNGALQKVFQLEYHDLMTDGSNFQSLISLAFISEASTVQLFFDYGYPQPNGSQEFIESVLLAHGSFRLNVLFQAIVFDQLDVVKVLLGTMERGRMFLNYKDERTLFEGEETPYEVAEHHGFDDIAEFILECEQNTCIVP